MPNNNLLRYRVPLGFVLAGWYVWMTRYAAWENFLPAFIVIAAGCALRSWAAGYLLKGKRVAVGGPYAFVRNPLYVGSFIIGAGFWWVLWRRPPPPSVLLFGAVYVLGFIGLYVAKGRSEEAELERALGPAYTAYRSKVPAFFPVRGRVAGLGRQVFSPELYKRNREYQCIWGCLALLALLIWRMQYGV